MSWEALSIVTVLAGIAAAGILRPFGRSRQPALQKSPSALEEEREILLRALRELDAEHTAGSVDDVDYRALRAETQVRAVAVLRELEAHRVPTAPARTLARTPRKQARGLRPTGGNGRSGRSKPRRLLPLLVAGIVTMALAGPALVAAVRARTPGDPFTGAGTTGANPIATFERRVRDDPNDVQARLELARAYLSVGDASAALQQYAAVLDLDRRHPEALASIGYLAYLAGRTRDALRFENQALREDPAFAEAMYYKGVILLDGLGRRVPAAEAFRDYLDAAPFGSHREEVQDLLARARGQA